MKKTVSVIMCAYNEEATIRKVFKKLKALDYITEIITVDNGSKDNTYRIMLEARKENDKIKIFQIKKNKGLGHGLKLAIQNTTGDIVIRQDADLEYDPDEMYNLVAQIENGNADVVYGSRMLGHDQALCFF